MRLTLTKQLNNHPKVIPNQPKNLTQRFLYNNRKPALFALPVISPPIPNFATTPSINRNRPLNLYANLNFTTGP